MSLTIKATSLGQCRHARQQNAAASTCKKAKLSRPWPALACVHCHVSSPPATESWLGALALAVWLEFEGEQL